MRHPRLTELSDYRDPSWHCIVDLVRDLMGNNDKYIVFVKVLLRLIVDLTIDSEDVCVVFVDSVGKALALGSDSLTVKQVAVDTGTKLAQSLTKHADLQYEHSRGSGKLALGRGSCRPLAVEVVVICEWCMMVWCTVVRLVCVSEASVVGWSVIVTSRVLFWGE
jgi:hypothetical protein